MRLHVTATQNRARPESGVFGVWEVLATSVPTAGAGDDPLSEKLSGRPGKGGADDGEATLACWEVNAGLDLSVSARTCRWRRAVISAPGFRGVQRTWASTAEGAQLSAGPAVCVSPGGTILVLLSEAAINILFVLARYRLCPDRDAATEVGHLALLSAWQWDRGCGV